MNTYGKTRLTRKPVVTEQFVGTALSPGSNTADHAFGVWSFINGGRSSV